MSGFTVQTGVGPIALRKPTEKEVIALEEARRQLLAPLPPDAPIAGLDDGRDIIRACITNLTPEAATALLRKHPGLVKRFLVEAFRAAGGAGDGFLRDPAAITHEHRKVYGKDMELVGLRCFDVPVVLRPISEERHMLTEIRSARDGLGFGVPFSEVAALGKEHIVEPKGDAAEALFAEHPYLAIDCGKLLLEMASGRDADLLGKLMSYSPPGPMTSSSPPSASSNPDSGSAGAPAPAPAP